MKRVIVIGSGMAGVAAALELQRRGADVLLVAGRHAATSLSSGAWDVADTPLRAGGDDPHTWTTSRENLERMIARERQHPYTSIQKNRTVKDPVKFVEEAFDALLKDLDFPMKGGLGKHISAITSVGLIRPTAFVQESMAGANLAREKHARVGVVGIKGLTGYPTSLIAKNLEKYVAHAVALDCEFSLFGEAPFSPFRLAMQLDSEDRRAEFVQKLAEQTEHPGLTHLIFPPVLGLSKTAEIIEALKRATQKECGEMLSNVPSVPGLRLEQATKAALAKHGIAVKEGIITEVLVEQGRVKRMNLQKGDLVEVLYCDACILATGKYIGGGIVKEGRFFEPLFDLPLFCQGRRVTTRFAGDLTKKDYLGAQALMTVGVKTNSSLQPINEWHEVIIENLYAAGGILSGGHLTDSKGGIGVAVSTGALAGKMVTL